METRKRMQKFLSIFLACIMILNVPMSALAYEDVMVLDAVEDLDVYAEQNEEDFAETAELIEIEEAGETAEAGEEAAEIDAGLQDESANEVPEVPAENTEAEPELDAELQDTAELKADETLEITLFSDEEIASLAEGDPTPAAEAVVRVTISDSGSPATAKDGTAMLNREVTVQDVNKDGILSYDEALTAAHNTYYEGGAAAGYATQDSESYGLGITKFWGYDEKNAFGYWLNDASCRNLSGAVKAGDSINAFIYKDKINFLDSYTKFAQAEYKAVTGSTLTVSVQKAVYDESYNMSYAECTDAVLTVYDSNYKVLTAENNYTIDGYQVTFKKAGTYYVVTAGTESTSYVPAAAKVVVEDENTTQKQYLKSLEIRPSVSDESEFVSILQEGKNEAEYKLSANQTAVYVRVVLTDDAPADSKATAVYYKSDNEKVTRQIPIDSEDGKKLPWLPTGMTPISVELTIGAGEDVQIYVINISRSLVIDTVKFTPQQEVDILQIDDNYYLPANQTLETVQISANSYGAPLTINEKTATDNTAVEVPVSFDEATGTFEITLTASHGQDTISRVLKILKYTEGDELAGKAGADSVWSLKNGILTISGNGAITNYTWKNYAKQIKEIVIEKGITEIGSYAFSTATGYASSSEYSSLVKITLPDGVTKIGEAAFKYDSALKEISLPEGLASIGEYAFQNCTSLQSITIPGSVTSLGQYSFEGCTGLETVSTGILGYGAFNGCSSLKNLTLKSELKSIPEWTFSRCEALEKVIIPNNVTEIGSYAFYRCTGLKEITIPEGVTSISGVFSNCTGLKKAVLPSTLKGINGTLFAESTELTDVQISGDNYVAEGQFVYSKDQKTLVWCLPSTKGRVEVPAGITAIGESAFSGNKTITEVVLPDMLETIGASAFASCSSLEKVTIPDKVSVIEKEAFKNCWALTEIKLPANITEISERLFYGCSKLKTVIVQNNVTKVGRAAFYECKSIEKIELPESITTIEENAFTYCKALKEFTVPSKVSTIPSMMLGGCSALKWIRIPVSVTSMNGSPYSENESLEYIFYEGTPQQWDAIKAESTSSKPEPPYVSCIILYGCASIGNNENAPKIAEQPQNQIVKEGQALKALQIKAEPLQEKGAVYYFDWYKKQNNKVYRVSGTPSEDGLGSSCMPSEATKENVEYYCMVEKVDASGAAVWTYSESAIVSLAMSEFTGTGLPTDPYQINTADDLMTLRKLVNEDGKNMSGICFQFMKDIELPADWTPIGATIDGTDKIQAGKNLRAFSGVIDGNNKTITVPEGGMPLLGYVVNAEVRNLNIYGTKIDGYGLVNNFEGVGLSGNAVVLDHITLKKGSSTLKSGLIGANITSENAFAGCSAGFVATIKNCTIEEGVVIGYNKDQKIIGSIAGRLQGTVENCVSHATVYGTDYVGGIVGARDNALGSASVKNCSFDGAVVASGSHAGGVVGGGYADSSAPNAIRISINGCNVAGTISGADKVGGILGGDTYCAQAWNAYTMKGNSFTGKVEAKSGNYVGGIIGFYDSLNKFDDITNNYYAKDCGAEKGIGFVQYVDTNCKTHETESGATYINSENGVEGFPTVAGCNWKPQHNRTDDPLGADADKLATSNANTEAYVEQLIISGTYKTEYYMGQDFDLTGMKFTAKWSDQRETYPTAEEVKVEGFTSSKAGTQEVSISYQDASATVTVTVKRSMRVTFTLLGDSKHDSDKDGKVHTLQMENLETWVPETVYYYTDLDTTVYDVIKDAAEQYGFTIGARDTQYGLYIESITWNGLTLSELDNGKNSGWMCTVNEIHPNVNLAAVYVENGDDIIFHYTDDYTQEESLLYDKQMAEEITETIAALPSADKLTVSDKAAVQAAREAYESLTAAQKEHVSAETLKQLEAAEARIAELEKKPHVHIWDEGAVTKAATCTATGVKTYKCGCGESKTETIPALGHKFGAWTTVSEATVKAAEVQKHTCSVCGASETQNVGSKLTPVLQLPGKISSFNMKKGKTTSFKVTMANGDSVTSVKSNKTKVLKATLDQNTGKITLKALKTGTAKLTINLDSKTSKTYTVKVVTGTVKTTGVSVTSAANKKLTLEKGKTHTLKTEVKPFTTTQKLTYKSSNKKVATVTSKGKIEAVAPGKATITVKSGSKSVKITVTVPGITNVKSSVTVKKNKTTTLKPQAYGISGKVTYTSSNPKVATVTSKGKVKGIKKGSAKITIKVGSYTKTVTVKVK